MIFPSNIPMIMSYLHRLLASAISAGIAEAVWDVDVYGPRLMPWKKVVRTCEATTLPTDVAKVPQTLQQFPVKSGEVFKGIEIWYADTSWGLRPYSLQSRSDCSCKVAAWGSWGTSLWSGEIVKLSLMLQVQVGIKPPSLNLAKHQVCSSFWAARISHYHELMTNTHFMLSHPHSEGNISLSSCVLQKMPFPLHHSLFQRCIRYSSINQPMVC